MDKKLTLEELDKLSGHLKIVYILWLVNAFVLTVLWWAWAYYVENLGATWANNPLVSLIVTHSIIKGVLTILCVVLFVTKITKSSGLDLL